MSGVRFQVSGARSAVAWQYYAARLPAGYCPPEPAPENVSRGTKSPQRGRLHSESSGSLGRGCYFSTLDFRLLDFEKLNEQRGNVYENKGPLWKTCRRSGNVIENKDSYSSIAGMSLKRKYVSCKSSQPSLTCSILPNLARPLVPERDSSIRSE